jgi:chloride channel protein, CIC family
MVKTPRTSSFAFILRWFLIRQKKYIGHGTYLILGSILVGVLSALAAVALKLFVREMHKLTNIFFGWSDTTLWYIILPLTGILLTLLAIRIFFKGRIEKGLGSILFSIVKRSGIISRDKVYSPLITSGLTVGLGGSAGLEAPIVISGSAIGSNIASWLNFGYRERVLLLACGAASGIAAVFNSPIAGVIFAVEVLLTDVTIPVFIPLLISTATSIIVSHFLYKGQLFFLITQGWYYHAIPFYIVMGIICGLLSVYMIRVNLFIEGFFDRKKRKLPKALAGGLMLGVLIFVFPPLFGEGYITIENLLKGDFAFLAHNCPIPFFGSSQFALLILAILIILLKIPATALTIGSGGNGGIFAPSLFTGGITGFAIAYGINMTGITHLHVSNFIVVGMAGIMSGVIHAPLTAIFLIAEITGGYVLFVPLMIVAALSYFITRYFEPYSVYTKNLAKKGHYVADDKDNTIFQQMDLADLIETEYIPVLVTEKFGALIEAFTKSKRNIFPVIDHENRFIGIIELETIKEFMFSPELYDKITVEELTRKDVLTIDQSENMDSVMKKLENTDLWNIPVLDGDRYAGFISRSNVLSGYRRILKKSASLF